jgi:hypothetical protein
MCAIIQVFQGKGATETQSTIRWNRHSHKYLGTPKNSRNLKKVLDKRHKVCYNLNVNKRWRPKIRKPKGKKGKIMNTNEITMRQFFESVVNNNITPAMVEKAKAEIAKLDATNAKRAEKAKEKAKEYEPIKTAIFDFLKANGTKTTAEIAVAVGESSPKTSAMCRQMVEENRLAASDVSVKGKGKQKAYTAIVE